MWRAISSGALGVAAVTKLIGVVLAGFVGQIHVHSVARQGSNSWASDARIAFASIICEQVHYGN